MQTSELSQHLSDLSEIDINVRTKSIRLLNKICNKILSNPSELKYQDLNFEKIRNKLEKCPPAISLLHDVGFKPSVNGLRLKWQQNQINSDLLQQLSQNLQQKVHIIKSPSNPTKSPPQKIENEGKIREMISVFFRVKQPNEDLTAQFTEQNRIIRQLQAQNAPISMIEPLIETAEALIFVSTVENFSKIDQDIYDYMRRLKQALEVWLHVSILVDADNSSKNSLNQFGALIMDLQLNLVEVLEKKIETKTLKSRYKTMDATTIQSDESKEQSVTGLEKELETKDDNMKPSGLTSGSNQWKQEDVEKQTAAMQAQLAHLMKLHKKSKESEESTSTSGK